MIYSYLLRSILQAIETFTDSGLWKLALFRTQNFTFFNQLSSKSVIWRTENTFLMLIGSISFSYLNKSFASWNWFPHKNHLFFALSQLSASPRNCWQGCHNFVFRILFWNPNVCFYVRKSYLERNLLHRESSLSVLIKIICFLYDPVIILVVDLNQKFRRRFCQHWMLNT